MRHDRGRDHRRDGAGTHHRARRTRMDDQTLGRVDGAAQEARDTSDRASTGAGMTTRNDRTLRERAHGERFQRAALHHRRQRRRRQEHADRPPAARLDARSAKISSRAVDARFVADAAQACSTCRCSPTVWKPSASRASPSTWLIATSLRHGANSSSPTRPGTSSTRATWSPARQHRRCSRSF